METNPTNDPFSGLAGLYALGALNADERKDFETHIETCQNCVNEVPRRVEKTDDDTPRRIPQPEREDLERKLDRLNG